MKKVANGLQQVIKGAKVPSKRTVTWLGRRGGRRIAGEGVCTGGFRSKRLLGLFSGGSSSRVREAVRVP